VIPEASAEVLPAFQDARTYAGMARVCKLLAGHKRALVCGALVAWERSPEILGEEIVALNVDETPQQLPHETLRQKSVGAFIANP
jgi:hypothetical protein